MCARVTPLVNHTVQIQLSAHTTCHTGGRHTLLHSAVGGEGCRKIQTALAIRTEHDSGVQPNVQATSSLMLDDASCPPQNALKLTLQTGEMHQNASNIANRGNQWDKMQPPKNCAKMNRTAPSKNCWKVRSIQKLTTNVTHSELQVESA